MPSVVSSNTLLIDYLSDERRLFSLMSDENFPLPKEKWKKNPFSSEVFPEDMLNTKGIIRSLAYEQGTNDFLTMEKETK